MDLNNKRKKSVNIDRETGNDEILEFLEKVNSKPEDDIDNVIKDSGSEFVLEECLEHELESDIMNH